MRNYLLLTPGPLSTSQTVREAMLQDWCTWDKDYNEGIVTPIRKGLLAIAGLDENEYTDVLLQGSGTYCVEATIGAAVKPADKLLILANGASGKRMAQIAEYYHIDHVLVSLHETELITGEVARRALEENPGITHLSMVHSETTTGLLNPIEEVAELADFSISPEQWGNFLCTLFDEWVKKDVGTYYIQLFDSTLANWIGDVCFSVDGMLSLFSFEVVSNSTYLKNLSITLILFIPI